MLPFDDLESADPAADHHPDARGIARVDVQPALRHRHRRRRDGELDEAPALLDLLPIQPLLWIETFDLSGKTRRMARRVEERDRREPRLSREDGGPRVLGAQPDGGHESDARHDYAPALPISCRHHSDLVPRSTPALPRKLHSYHAKGHDPVD